MKKEFQKLESWFFETGDGCVAALLRIGFGLYFLLILGDIYPVLDLLLGEKGLYGSIDIEGFIDLQNPMNLLYWIDSPGGLRIWFWITVMFASLMVLGLFTRTTTLLSYLCLLLFQQRNPWILFGADKVMFQVGIWLLFLKSGSVWSLDHWIQSRKKNGKTLSTSIPLWPIKAIQIQVATLYLSTAIAKVVTEEWQEGSALYYAFNRQDLTFQWVEYLLPHKFLLTFMTYSSLSIEMLFPFLIFWKPTRWIALLSMASLHLGIDLLMQIRFFSLIMYWCLLSFLLPREVRSVLKIK